MGLHPSLKRAESLVASRSVMKRIERIKWLKEKGQWDESKGVLGLPKIKVVKIKAAKKGKAKEEEKKEEQQPAAKNNSANNKKT